MKTKTIISTLIIAVVAIFTLVSFTNKETEATDQITFDSSLYEMTNTSNSIFESTKISLDNAKCGGDKKAKDSDKKDAKKCGAGKCGDDAKKAKKEAKESKCGAGKCGDDAKKAKDTKKESKSNEDKDAKCGTGKCG